MLNFEGQRPRILCATLEAFGLLQHNRRQILILVGLAHAMAFTEDVPKFMVDDLDAVIVESVLV